MKRSLALVLLCAAPLLAGEAAIKPPRAPQKAVYRVRFTLKSGALSRSGSFLAGEAGEADYSSGAELPVEITNNNGTGVEFKKEHYAVSCLIVKADEGAVAGEFQFEISGPQPADPDSKLKVKPVTTFQYKTSLRLPLGKPVAAVDEPDRRVEITVERAD